MRNKKHGLHLNKRDYTRKYEAFNKYTIIGNWVNSETRVVTQCNNCKNKWNAIPYNIAKGKSKCPYCEGAKTNIDTLYLSELCKDKGFEVLSECNSASDEVLFRHIKCGTEFTRKASVLIRHFSCPNCKVNSRGEEEVTKVLNKYNVRYKKECAFNDLRGTKGGYLRFDFGIYENDELRYFIEYDGKQHEENVGYEYFGESYEKAILHDKIKNKYCEDNNYILLRISYHKRRTIEKIVVDFLNKHMLIPSQANENQ